MTRAAPGQAGPRSVGPLKGGHSSSPPDHTAIGLVGRAIAAVESHPLPLRLQGPGRVMLDYLTPELPFLARILFANIWCFRWLLEVLLWHDVSLRPFFWTTQAVTVVQVRTVAHRLCRHRCQHGGD